MMDNTEIVKIERAMILMGLVSTAIGMYVAWLQLKKLKVQYNEEGLDL
jgi:hypothetical protein